MKLYRLFAACLLLAACNDNKGTTNTTSTVSTDSLGLNLQQTTSVSPAARDASSAMMEDMRNMMASMKSMALTGDPDNDFAMMMKVHHESAVSMANKELQSGADAELKGMAEKMRADQEKEVGELQEFLNNHKPSSKSDFGEKSMKMMEGSPLMNLPMKSDPDQDFAALMAEHHKEAVEMSTEYLKTGKDARIREMAQKMISKQKEEIGRLNDWTQRHASKG